VGPRPFFDRIDASRRCCGSGGGKEIKTVVMHPLWTLRPVKDDFQPRNVVTLILH
jgi:hypothetical protein